MQIKEKYKGRKEATKRVMYHLDEQRLKEGNMNEKNMKKCDENDRKLSDMKRRNGRENNRKFSRAEGKRDRAEEEAGTGVGGVEWGGREGRQRR